jgi:hypothetical protein
MSLDEHYHRMRTEGTRAAERDFWRAVQAELRRFYRTRDHAVKEELVSRATLVVMRKLDEFEPIGPNSCTRWVRKIARLERCDLEREEARAGDRRERLREWAAALRRTSPLTWVLRRVNLETVRRFVATLSTPQREALRYEDARALAAARGIGIRAARMRRRRALQRLADLIDTLSTARPTSVRDVTPS